MPLLQADRISTDPYDYETAVAATDTLSIDMAEALLDGESFTSATAVLRNLKTGVVTTLTVTAVNGTAVVITLNGATIGYAVGDVYALVVFAHISASQKRPRRLYVRVVG